MTNIIIATIKSWNVAHAKELKQHYKDTYNITIITDKKKLTNERLKKLNPRYVFFPHWSWIIPETIFNNFTCVVFHMTDLPFGRGGSPLQNLISRGVYKTKISSLKVDGGLDTGPIYMKRPMSLKHGTAAELYKKVADVVFTIMIPHILKKNPLPKPQTGRVTAYPRRKAEESNLLTQTITSLSQVYDLIRMVDAEGYPPAFIPLSNGYELRLTQAKRSKNNVKGSFEITKSSHT
jgi:methionyl-tRNA formyltransferase